MEQKVKLIYNPKAGATRKEKFALHDIIRELKIRSFEPDICIIDEACDLATELNSALSAGIETFVVCGGDGTVSPVSNILANTDARLAIIPCGTQNNNAKSLNIPLDLPRSVALLQTGKEMKIDIGLVSCGQVTTHFIELVTVGLVAALTESGDEIQHGNISGIGPFLSTLVSSSPAKFTLFIDENKRIESTGHVALITNMPYFGYHFQSGETDCCKDGYLHVSFFSDLSKLDLLKYVSTGIYLGKPEDPRIQHYLVKKVDIETQPPRLVAADAKIIGEGNTHIELCRKALRVIAGRK